MKADILNTLKHSELGQKSAYIDQYDASLLFPIPRQGKRDEIDVPTPLPFKGFDQWNAYELSWLNKKGKPVVAIGEFTIPCESPNIIESKSFKLYLNSFNHTTFESFEQVQAILTQDLIQAASADVTVKLIKLNRCDIDFIPTLSGIYLDDLDIACDTYLVDPTLLRCESNEMIEETLYSDLLKSNCLVTGQPDWGSVQIQYQGPKINHESLLKYIVSLRNHNEFHEQCVERIFMDILRQCKPQQLTVHARYTRRGGLDINPIRSTKTIEPTKNIRLARQ